MGFRPHVWRLAGSLGLVGSVANDGEGVLVKAWGENLALDRLIDRLVAEAPPLARIEQIEQHPHDGPAPAGFTIAASSGGAVRTGIAPDAATCIDCLAEVHDPDDRRFGHAFANCTHCGPRLSIVRSVPYDRDATSMAAFAMCPDCKSEYGDPADRRFHAQPVACPQCGPRLWIEPAMHGDPLDAAARLLAAGRIVAIKGIGGFHLACDATNAQAVNELRRRKARDAKPFAVMVASIEEAERYCEVEPVARALMLGAEAPIVLLPIRAGTENLPDGIAPDQDHLGLMLPYTPLHHLLLGRLDFPLVMTSGNRSDEPQATANHTARERLDGLADAWLMHDREIINRIDDSVLALGRQGPFFIRRARGYAPAPLQLHRDFKSLPRVLAMGGELKATFCLLQDGQAVLSQHIGDLEQAEALGDYQAMLALYRQLFDFTPDVVAIDRHADYLSSQAGISLAAECGARLVRVAHHHAHLAACLADSGLGIEASERGLFGVTLDGLGLGEDGTLWGGEVLYGGFRSAGRIARIAPVALPGGGAAMREPWRNLVAHLRHAFGENWHSRAAPVSQHLPDPTKLAMIERMIATNTNSWPCSSAGRLFDAVAAALGVHPLRLSHEAQAAMALEALARPYLEQARPYSHVIDGDDLLEIGWQSMWEELLADLARGDAPGLLAARFHKGFAAGLVAALEKLGATGQTVALSGGVLQNRIMADELTSRLEAIGCTVLGHRQVPANDGGLALGQAVLGGLIAQGEAPACGR